MPFRTHSRAAIPYLFAAPALLVLAAFIYWPIVYSVWLSLHDVNLLSGRMRFVGLENYADLAQSEGFQRSVAITATFVVASVPLRLALALFLAQLLVSERRTARVLRGVFFLPYVSSTAAIAVVWSWLFSTDLGLINTAIRLVGGTPQNWLYDADTALFAIVAVSIWKQLGYDLVLFIAGLQAISPTLYEAARIDGAGRFHQFRTLTLPLLTPTLLFLLVISVIDSFQIFTLVNVMTRGGPALSTDVVVMFFYRMGFVRLDYGTASAVVVILFLTLLVLTLLKFGVLGRKVNYDPS